MSVNNVSGVGKTPKSGNTQNPREAAAMAQSKDAISVKMPQGKGLLYLANKYGMTLDEFCRLNGITKDYSPKADEVFYVIDKSKAEKNAATELGAKIYETSGKYRGAVGKPEFDSLIKQVTPKNVENVLKNYTKKESLINTITSEISSDANKRKEAVMHIYNALATAKKTPDAIKKRFEAELEDQFDSLGMVSTKKLDKILNNMMLSPKDLGDKLYRYADKHSAAVGDEEFETLIDLISPHNVEGVLNNYTKKESLISTITSEVGSNPNKRKAAVMKVYDALATLKKTPKEKREAFVKELNAQFDKTFGMVSTKKLDEMISEMLKTKTPAKPTPVRTSTSGTSGASVPQNNTKVSLGNGKTLTVAQIQKGAIKSAENEARENFKEYCKANGIKYDENLLDTAPISRIPAPVVKNGRIVTAESAVLQPTVPANGKVIIINPGHGGYNTRNGFFDPGTYSFIKKANGKYAPLIEYDKMKKYGDSVTEKLRAQGYAVVIMGSHYKTMSADNAVASLIQRLNNGTKCNKKYNMSDIMFISLHADSEPGHTGTGICYTPSFADDGRLKDSLINSFNSDSWFKGKASGSERNGLFVLNTSKNIPSVLVEVEYVNGSKSQNLDSSDFQRKFEDRLIAGINNYYGIGQ